MNSKTTYLLCPDRDCQLFFDVSKAISCEYHCPEQDDLVKIILCWGCEETIELPGDHHGVYYITHNKGNCSALNKQRLSGNYCLIYERPE